MDDRLKTNTLLYGDGNVFRVLHPDEDMYRVVRQDLGTTQLIAEECMMIAEYERLGLRVYWAEIGERYELVTSKGKLVFDLLNLAYRKHEEKLMVQVRILSKDSLPLKKPKVGWVEETELQKAVLISHV
jgi:hypothetical protein